MKDIKIPDSVGKKLDDIEIKSPEEVLEYIDNLNGLPQDQFQERIHKRMERSLEMILRRKKTAVKKERKIITLSGEDGSFLSYIATFFDKEYFEEHSDELSEEVKLISEATLGIENDKADYSILETAESLIRCSHKNKYREFMDKYNL